MTECLDAWAVLRWLEGSEPAAGRVERALTARPVMSWINLGEVPYVVERRAGPEQARQVVQQVRHQIVICRPSPVSSKRPASRPGTPWPIPMRSPWPPRSPTMR